MIPAGCIPIYYAGNRKHLEVNFAVLEMIFFIHRTNVFSNLPFSQTFYKLDWNEITRYVLVRCSIIVCDHNVKLAGHFQNLAGQCQATGCNISSTDFEKYWILSLSLVVIISAGTCTL